MGGSTNKGEAEFTLMRHVAADAFTGSRFKFKWDLHFIQSDKVDRYCNYCLAAFGNSIREDNWENFSSLKMLRGM
jgi:hypothetical protein